MAGIQIYTESPISPAVHAPNRNSTIGSNQDRLSTDESTTHSTASPPQSQGTQCNELTPTQASTTVTPSIVPTHTPALPQISPPTPTVTSASTATYVPATEPISMFPQRAPSTTTSAPSSPEPAVLPTPLHSRSRSASPRRDIPPPPRVGEKMKAAAYYSPTPTPTYPAQSSHFPPQISLPPLSDPRSGAQPPASATLGGRNGLLSPHPNTLLSPARTFSSPAETPTTGTMPQNSLEHPPGYVQNPYAADMTPEQRFASQRGAGSPSLGYNDNNAVLGGVKSPSGVFQGFGGMASPRPGGGILNGDGKNEDGSVWGVVSGWAKGAGKKLGEVEGEVWRRINGD